MPAKSQAQQKLFGMIHAGKKPRPNGMSAAQVEHMASTRRKGLPKHAEKSARRRKIAEIRSGG